jgi:D-serine dehydratase
LVNLQDIETTLLDGTTKGMPGGIAPIALGEVGNQGWNLLREDLPLPLAVLRESALAHNSDWMRRFLEASGAVIAPHGKTTMSPQLFRRQINDGAWAITVGSVQQLQVARRHGFKRLVLANQLVGARAIRYVLEEIEGDPGFDFYSLVDSVEQAKQLSAAARAVRLSRPYNSSSKGAFTAVARAAGGLIRRLRWRASSGRHRRTCRCEASVVTKASCGRPTQMSSTSK